MATIDFGLSVVNFNGCGGGSSSGNLDIFDENGKIRMEFLPDGITTSSLSLYMCTSAKDTPKDIVWFDGTDYITGELEPSKDTLGKIYFVLQNADANAYNQYATFVNESGKYEWKCIGSGIYENEEIIDIEERLSKLEETIEETSTWTDVK